jgi:cyclopropane-fatty-acyl-phospholipid synthase
VSLSLDFAERGWLPDSLVRAGIRKLLRDRLRQEHSQSLQVRETRIQEFVEFLAHSPIAVETRAANEQHYELPPEFFEKVLGPRLKYSACLWKAETRSIAEAEIDMLRLTAERAEIEEGQRILDLGCGWGSFSLWAAEQFPGVCITAVSNSTVQKEHIQRNARDRGLRNLEVLTQDMNDFSSATRFDRIVSIEMLEHLRNYATFFSRVRGWLEKDGKFFVHIFCHKNTPYAFEPVSEADWMARYFFSGGMMPSKDLFRSFDKDLRVSRDWSVNGVHYSKTLEAWLENQDRHREEILKIFTDRYGSADSLRWFQRWRMFFMACSELFRFNQGEEWLVGHFLLTPK